FVRRPLSAARRRATTRYAARRIHSSSIRRRPCPARAESLRTPRRACRRESVAGAVLYAWLLRRRHRFEPEAIHRAVVRPDVDAAVGDGQTAEMAERFDLVAARPQF